MSVVVETTLGDITIDLFIKERPRASLNFLKLCKIKYFNYNLFHTISRGFIAQTGDPTGTRNGGESIFGVLEGPLKRYFEGERNPRKKHTTMGLVSFVGTEDHMIGSQFFITLGTELTYLDEQHCVFGEVMEGLDVLELLNEVICDQDNRPYQDVRITHTVVLDDPFPDPEYLRVPTRSPSPTAERLQGGRIAPDEEIDETHGRSLEEVNEIVASKEAKARATILEMIGDIPDAEMAPPENVLFVCKLNPVTTDDDLEIIFSRFGKINSCEVIRDKKTDESLQYAFVEFDDHKACEDAYFKMDNVLIDDRRIHVDFSQSVAKVKWHGKGRGVTTYNDKGKKITDSKNDLGNGRYKRASNNSDKRENYHRDRHTEDKKYNREDERRVGSTKGSNYRGHSQNKLYDRRRQSNEYKKYDTGQMHSRRYDNYKSGIRQDDKSKERNDHKKPRNRSRSFEKQDKKDTKRLSRQSRSRSRDNYKDKKADYARDKERYDFKKTKSSHSKHSKQKKKQYKSSTDSSSTEDDSESSIEEFESKRKPKKKHSESPAMQESKSKKAKKKNKSKKRKYSDSSEES